MLKMAGNLPYSSPLVGIADAPVGPESARLTDWSGRSVLDIRRRSSLPALRSVFGTGPDGVGKTARLEHGILCQLRADRWVYIALSAQDEAHTAATQLAESSVVLDATHAYGILHLRGAQTPDMLAQLCALDFDDRVFPDGRAPQTSLAKVPAIIIRADENVPAYMILVGRSLAAYVWAIVAETVRSVR